jgi:hypothetical protein
MTYMLLTVPVAATAMRDKGGSTVAPWTLVEAPTTTVLHNAEGHISRGTHAPTNTSQTPSNSALACCMTSSQDWATYLTVKVDSTGHVGMQRYAFTT